MESPHAQQSELFAEVDRLLARAASASKRATRDELREVGRAIEELVMALSQHLYKPALHEPRSGPKPGASAINRLDAYMDVEFAGIRKEPSRILAKSSLQSLGSLLVAGTEDIESAELCVQSAQNLVNVLRISKGRLQPGALTLSELIKRFLDSKLDVMESQRSTLNVIARSEFARKRVAEFTADHLIEYCRALGRSVKPSTVGMYVTSLRRVLVTASEFWRIDVPLDQFEQATQWLQKQGTVSKSERRTRLTTEEEKDALLKHFEKADALRHTKIPMRDIMVFALYSGIARGVIFELRWDDLDEVKRTLRLPGKPDRVQIFSDEAWNVVEKQKTRRVPHDGRIFPYNGKSVGKRYIDAKIKLGIQDLRFHDLRKTAALHLTEAHNLAIDEVAKTIGRADLNTLRRDLEDARDDHSPEQAA